MSVYEHCSMNSKVHFCKCRKHTRVMCKNGYK